MSDDEFDPWWREALCREIGTNLFFLRAGEPGYEAKRACRMCPVRAKCLADAITTDIPYGIFGGLGETARRPLALRVRAGADPLAVANQYIEKEKTDGAGRPADHRRAVRRGRRP